MASLDWQTLLQNAVFKVVGAIIIVLLGVIIGRIVGNLIQRLLHRIHLNQILKESGVNLPIEQFVNFLIRYIIYFGAIILALQQLGLTATILYIIFISFLAIIIIFIILAVKDFIPNMIAGLFIHYKSLLKKGDFIKINDMSGRVLVVGLVETQLETNKKEVVYLPNSILTNTKIVKLKK